jgi:amino acid adenylation domain-containing protein
MSSSSDKRRELAARLLERGLRRQAPAVSTHHGLARLSRGQRRLWFLEQLHPGTAQNNIALALALSRQPTREHLARALHRLQSVHEALRYRFTAERDDPAQTVAADVRVPLAWHDLTSVTPDRAEAMAVEIAATEARRPLDLGDPPLYRATAVSLPGQRWWLVLVFHHIVVDGWSVGVLLADLAALLGGRDVEPPATTFAQWVATRDDGEAPPHVSRYWKARFADDPPAATLAVRTGGASDRARRGGLLGVEIASDVSRAVDRLARRLGVTAYVVCLAAFMLLLRRMSDLDPIVVGTPAAGRDHPELDRVVGFFVLTIPIRTDVALHDSFADVVTRVQRAVVDALDHQPMPFEDLVAITGRSGPKGANPLFRSMFGWENGILGEFEWAGQRGRMWELDTGTAKFDLTFSLAQTEDGIRGTVEWSADGTDAITARGALVAFEAILRAVVEEPGLRVDEVPLVVPAVPDRRGPLDADLGPARPGPPPESTTALLTLADGMVRQIAASPEALAVVDAASGARLTYAELGTRVALTTHRVREAGVLPGDRVGLLLERSVDMVVGVHAVTAAGCSYVPIDTDAPPARVEYLLRSAGVRLVLVHEATRHLVPAGLSARLAVPASGVQAEPAALRTTLVPASAPAYLLFTSGSTGQPKPVAFPTDASQAFLDWLQARMPLRPGDRMLLKTPYGFDVSVWELFWPLQRGATLVVAEPGGHRDPAGLARLIASQQVNVVNFVPSLLEAFLNEPAAGECGTLRWILAAGEQLAAPLRDRVHERFAATLVNLYGPTECGAITAHFLEREDRTSIVPIGRSLPHAEVRVLDQNLRPLAPGLRGELYVGGRLGVAIGYWGNPSLTAERFIPDPFGGRPGGRLYRTGDACRELPEGGLEYLGRLDRQVKIQGVRIEPAEIEFVLAGHPSVASVRVVAMGDAREGELAAFYTVEPGYSIDPDDLRGCAVARLPGHLVPTAAIQVERLPVNLNGKTDVAALERTWRMHRHAALPLTGVSRSEREQVRAAFQSVLGRPSIDPDESFFALGGNSFLLLKLAVELERRTGYRPGIAELAEHPTVEQLALILRGLRSPSRMLVPLAPAAGAPHLVLAPPVSGSVLPYVPLSQAIGPELSVYGIEAPGLDGSRPPPRTVTEFVAAMVPAVESLDSDRPLVLAGWSFGGVLAYEMSVALAERGMVPVATIIIDAWIPTESGGERVSGAETMEFLRAEGHLPDELADGDLRAIEKVAGACMGAFLAYRPSFGIRNPVVLFKATDGYPGVTPEGYIDNLGWDTIVEELEVDDVAGGHFEILSPHHAVQLAEAVTSVARRRLERVRSKI